MVVKSFVSKTLFWVTINYSLRVKAVYICRLIYSLPKDVFTSSKCCFCQNILVYAAAEVKHLQVVLSGPLRSIISFSFIPNIHLR